MWNEAINDLVARHMGWSDFEVEAKLKNIASEGLARHVERHGQHSMHESD
jgi:UV DNA damage endonuclease